MTATTHLTRYLAEFIQDAKPADLSAEVTALGKKSILDGLGIRNDRDRLDVSPKTASAQNL